MARLTVPDHLNRNSARAAREGAEQTGEKLLALVTKSLGLTDLSGVDVLDVGCGVRFAQTILNRDIPIKSYTGVDVHLPLIDFLRESVDDSRFAFAHWDVNNAMYNPGTSARMERGAALPIEGDFDVVWLFSVFTHLDPQDSDALLGILRRYVRPNGRLFFSAFLPARVQGFQDLDPANPLVFAAYSEDYMRELVTRNGWEVLRVDAPDAGRIIQHQFLCKPSDR